MATPPSPFTTVNGKRCTRVPRTTTTITLASSTVTSTGDLSTTAAFSASTTLSAFPTAALQNGLGRSLSPGSVAAVVLGSFAGVILAGLVLLWCIRKTRERNRVFEITDKIVSEKKPGRSRFNFGSASNGLREHPSSVSSPFPFLNTNRTFRTSRGNRESQGRPSSESSQAQGHNRSTSAPRFKPVQEVTDSFKRRIGHDRLPSIDSSRSFQSAFPAELPGANANPFADSNRVSIHVANMGELSLPRKPGIAAPNVPFRPTAGVARMEKLFLDPPDRAEIPSGLRKLVSGERLRAKAEAGDGASNLVRPIKGKAIVAGEGLPSKLKTSENVFNDSGYASLAHRSAGVAPLKIARKYSPLTQLAISPAQSVEDPDTRPASILILPSSRTDSYDSAKPVTTLPSSSFYSRPAPIPRSVPTSKENRGRPQFRAGSPKSSRASSRHNSYLRRRSQSRRRKSDPFDLDRPEVLGNFEDGFVMAAMPRLTPSENPFSDDAAVDSSRLARSNSRRAAAGTQAEAAVATTRRVLKAIVPKSPRSPRGPFRTGTAF